MRSKQPSCAAFRPKLSVLFEDLMVSLAFISVFIYWIS